MEDLGPDLELGQKLIGQNGTGLAEVHGTALGDSAAEQHWIVTRIALKSSVISRGRVFSNQRVAQTAATAWQRWCTSTITFHAIFRGVWFRTSTVIMTFRSPRCTCISTTTTVWN
jgi:hypothetical protein